MNPSLRLFWTGLSVFALGVAGCGDSGTSKESSDGGGGAGATAGSHGGHSGSAGGAGGAGQAGNSAEGGQAGGLAGAGGLANADAGGLDTNVPPPAMLTATVLDRRATTFELLWTAPSNNGTAVTGYQVRYAKVPITTTNFDDATITTTVAYVGTPAAPGETDGMIVKAYIENGYYFAVTGTDSTNAHVGTFMATTAAVTAHFNQSIINSPAGTNEQFGLSSDGSGDVNGDGFSDIIVGTNGANRAYLFLGASNSVPSAPSVTFSSAADPFFGYSVAQIGDIDGDGLQDIAIGDLSVSTILIYKGRSNWPLTLTDAQADYVITPSATLAAGLFGLSMARLGDFDGDGIDDFVAAAPLDNSSAGRALVIFGRSGFKNLTLPDVTRTLEIAPDPALTGTEFGWRVVGLGHFYSANTGTTLIVSAPGTGNASTATSNNEGRLYAFHGRGPAAPIDATQADNVVVGAGKGALIGQVLSNLGPMINGLPSVGSGNTNDAIAVPGAHGNVAVFSGTITSGPFSGSLLLTQSSGTSVGEMLFGGGLSGRDISRSIIGSAKPDLAITGQSSTVDIIDGDKISGLTSPTDADQAAAVRVTLPSGWSLTTIGAGGLVPDVNGDSYPDFTLSDDPPNSPGRIAIFW
jgi:hypothetical protein